MITITAMSPNARDRLIETLEAWQKFHHATDVPSEVYRAFYWYFRYSGLAGEGSTETRLGRETGMILHATKGTKVRFWTGIREGDGREGTLSYSGVFEMCDTHGVYISGVGFVALTHVEEITEEENA